MELRCRIYKHPKKEEMYLYVKEDCIWDDLPQGLREQFSNPQHVMDLLLTPQRRLARENILTVIQNLQTQGFYLQLPPVWTGQSSARDVRGDE